MKKLVAILLSLVMIMQAAYQGLIYGYYTINKDSITLNHCINKATPKLKCDGKCYLKELIDIKTTIQSDISSEIPSAPSLAEIKPMILFCESFFNLSQATISQDIIALNSPPLFGYQFSYKYLGESSSFKPPQQSV